MAHRRDGRASWRLADLGGEVAGYVSSGRKEGIRLLWGLHDRQRNARGSFHFFLLSQQGAEKRKTCAPATLSDAQFLDVHLIALSLIKAPNPPPIECYAYTDVPSADTKAEHSNPISTRANASPSRRHSTWEWRTI
jgi:hypothetical protein